MEENNRTIMIRTMIDILKDIKATLYALGKDHIADKLLQVIIEMEKELY